MSDPSAGRNVARFMGMSYWETSPANGPVAIEGVAPVGTQVRDERGRLRSGALLTICDNVGGFCGGLAALPDGWVVTTNLMLRAADLDVVGPLDLASEVWRRGDKAIVTSVRCRDRGRDGTLVASASITSAVLVPEGGPPRWERPARMSIPEDPLAATLPPFYEWLGLRPSDDGDGVELEVFDELRNPWGFVHGGVTASLIDAAGVEAVGDGGAATFDAVVHFLAPSRVGPIRAHGRVIGSRVDGHVVEVAVRDEGVDRVTAYAVTTVR